MAYARIGLKFDVNLNVCHAPGVTADREPEDDLMDRIAVLGRWQVAAERRLAELDAELRPLLPRAYAEGHYPTELASLTRWDRGQVRLIIDPGAARRGRAARDPERQPKTPGRKPKTRAEEG